MATATKKRKTSKQVIKERTRLEWILLILLLVIAYLLLASHYTWWPNQKTYNNLGTAFYAGIKSKDADKESAATPASTVQNGSGTNSSGSGSGNNANSGSTTNPASSNGGGNGTNPGTGGGSNQSPGSNTGNTNDSSILTLASKVNIGDSKETIQAQVNGVSNKCTVVVDTTILGKQEVCIYTQGNKIITVTLLNNKVISASRSGF